MDNGPITKQELLEALESFKAEFKRELMQELKQELREAFDRPKVAEQATHLDEVLLKSILIRVAALEKRLNLATQVR